MARAQSLTEDTVHTLLSDSQRYQLLYLLEQNGRSTVDELARQIAEREQESEEQVSIALVHKHLPLLEDHDVIRYHPESQEVVLMDVVDDFRPYLEEQTHETSILQKLVPGY